MRRKKKQAASRVISVVSCLRDDEDQHEGHEDSEQSYDCVQIIKISVHG
jgi:hypothetical protein